MTALYFDLYGGSDSNNGLSPEAPKLTPSAATVAGGDRMLLKRGTVVLSGAGVVYVGAQA